MIKQKKKVLFFFFILGLLVLTGWGCKKAVSPGGEEPKAGEKLSLEKILGTGKEIKNLSYEEVTTTPQGTFTAKVWKKDNKMKRESEFQDKTTVMYFYLDEGKIYLYDPATKTAIEMSAEAAETEEVDTEKESIDEYLDKIDPLTEIKGTEIIEGKMTVIVEITVGNFQEKIWIWQDYGLPLKIEARSPEMELMTMEVKNLDVGGVSESDVTLPKDAQIMQLPTFPGMPGFGE